MFSESGMWIRALLLLAAGILAANAMIVSKKPNAKELIDKMVPYAGIIGIAVLVFGIIDLIGIGKLNPHYFDKLDLWSIDQLGISIKLIFTFFTPLALLLGFYHGYNILDKYVFNKAADSGGVAGDKVNAAGDAAHAKMAGWIGYVGIAGIALALLMIFKLLFD